jgi:hypothetical protein
MDGLVDSKNNRIIIDKEMIDNLLNNHERNLRNLRSKITAEKEMINNLLNNKEPTSRKCCEHCILKHKRIL